MNGVNSLEVKAAIFCPYGGWLSYSKKKINCNAAPNNSFNASAN
jgi:hypothetical protein